MVIFPLSWPGKIALMLIALALGLTYLMMSRPDLWRKVVSRFKKNKKE